MKTRLSIINLKYRLVIRISLCLLLLTFSMLAADDLITSLITQLEVIEETQIQALITKYSQGDQPFKESYILNADIYLFKIRLGRMKLGEVVINEQDSFMIVYDPPFDKWDTRYLTYWIGNKSFVDEVSGTRPEKFTYRKSENRWQLIDYQAVNPRSYKANLFEKGAWSGGLNLIEFTRHLAAGRIAPANKIFFLGEEYQINSENRTTANNRYKIYDFKWNIHEGEENVRLYGVHLVGIEKDDHFTPLGGILKVSFVGLLGVDLIGIINTNQ
jgi:hypothetical protein